MLPKKCKKEKWNENIKYTCRSKQKCDLYFLHTRNRSCKVWEETFSYLGSWHKLYKRVGFGKCHPLATESRHRPRELFPNSRAQFRVWQQGPTGVLWRGAQAWGVFILLIFAKCIDIGEQDLCESWHILTCQSTVFKYTIKPDRKEESQKKGTKPLSQKKGSHTHSHSWAAPGGGAQWPTCALLAPGVCLSQLRCDRGSHIRTACWLLPAALWPCRPCNKAQVGGRRDILGARQGGLFGAVSSSLGELRRHSAGSNFVKLYKHLNQFYSMYTFYFMKEVNMAFKF